MRISDWSSDVCSSDLVGSLKRAVDGIVHFSRVADTGEIGSDIREFMDFAREQGPLVGDTLKQIAIAAIHVLTAASDVGVGFLQLRSEERRVGKGCVSTCRSRWSPSH